MSHSSSQGHWPIDWHHKWSMRAKTPWLDYFYAPGLNDWGHVVFVLSVVNFNLHYNFWTVKDRSFIFGMHTSLRPFKWHQGQWPCDLDLYAKNSLFGLCCSRGHTVFHKHMYFFDFSCNSSKLYGQWTDRQTNNGHWVITIVVLSLRLRLAKIYNVQGTNMSPVVALIVKCDYYKSVLTIQINTQSDTGHSDPNKLLCLVQEI